MSHEEWLAQLVAGDSQRTVAGKVGVQQSKISRQLANGKLNPELVIALARAYEVSPVDALVDTNYLATADIEGAGIAEALGYATNRQLLDEVRRRSKPDAVRLLRGGDGTITPKGKQISSSNDPEPGLRRHEQRFERNVNDADDRTG